MSRKVGSKMAHCWIRGVMAESEYAGWGWKCTQEAAFRDLEVKPTGLDGKRQPRRSETGVRDVSRRSQVCVWWSGGTLTGQAQWKGSPSSICAAGFWGGEDTSGLWKSPFKKRMLWTLEWWGKGLIPNDIFWVTEGKTRNLSGTHGSTLFWIKLIVLYCLSDDSIIRDSLVRYKVETRFFF